MQIIQKYYDAFNNQDWNTMLSCLTEDVRHDVNQGERQAGKEAFRSFLQKMDSAYSEKVVDLVIFEGSTGDRAAAEFIIEGVYKVSEPGLPPAHGQTYRLPVGAFFEIRRGLIDRVTNYYNLQDWIKQVS